MIDQGAGGRREACLVKNGCVMLNTLINVIALNAKSERLCYYLPTEGVRVVYTVPMSLLLVAAARWPAVDETRVFWL